MLQYLTDSFFFSILQIVDDAVSAKLCDTVEAARSANVKTTAKVALLTTTAKRRIDVLRYGRKKKWRKRRRRRRKKREL